ncbi:hypothetical protein [Trichoplusia ni ascovirus 2c]|uniref:hypothetical protein n=1 Tax=Trichoplusia ni ascovirus 2c TaxID=328615 RepID=UPI0000E441F0|nr:hypothetical protein TNAV2c_gp024 [Trichoplusia ni ascovirus 2c]ABF70541.1 hypothetical protein [Trichoplusia ni ascovirus 2c]
MNQILIYHKFSDGGVKLLYIMSEVFVLSSYTFTSNMVTHCSSSYYYSMDVEKYILMKIHSAIPHGSPETLPHNDDHGIVVNKKKKTQAKMWQELDSPIMNRIKYMKFIVKMYEKSIQSQREHRNQWSSCVINACVIESCGFALSSCDYVDWVLSEIICSRLHGSFCHVLFKESNHEHHVVASVVTSNTTTRMRDNYHEFDYFIDASNGKVIKSSDKTEFARCTQRFDALTSNEMLIVPMQYSDIIDIDKDINDCWKYVYNNMEMILGRLKKVYTDDVKLADIIPTINRFLQAIQNKHTILMYGPA